MTSNEKAPPYPPEKKGWGSMIRTLIHSTADFENGPLLKNLLDI